MKPSAPVSSRRTNRPERVTPEMRPSKRAPIWPARNCASRRSAVSRSAFMARRSVAEMCWAMPGKLERFVFGEAVVAEAQRLDQRAMHDQVGIAADGRGEVGVAVEVEAEMAVILVRSIRPGPGERSTISLTCSTLPALRAWARMPLKSLARTLSDFLIAISSEPRKSRRACSFSEDGSSWTR